MQTTGCRHCTRTRGVQPISTQWWSAGARGDGVRVGPVERLGLLAARADGSLLLPGNPAGTAAGGDFRRVMRLDANDRLQTLHQDPRGEADLDEVVVDPRTQQPLAAS